jgi:hypothetical protein
MKRLILITLFVLAAVIAVASYGVGVSSPNVHAGAGVEYNADEPYAWPADVTPTLTQDGTTWIVTVTWANTSGLNGGRSEAVYRRILKPEGYKGWQMYGIINDNSPADVNIHAIAHGVLKNTPYEVNPANAALVEWLAAAKEADENPPTLPTPMPAETATPSPEAPTPVPTPHGDCWNENGPIACPTPGPTATPEPLANPVFVPVAIR